MKTDEQQISDKLADIDQILDDINLVCFNAERFPVERKRVFNKITKNIEKIRLLLAEFQEK